MSRRRRTQQATIHIVALTQAAALHIVALAPSRRKTACLPEGEVGQRLVVRVEHEARARVQPSAEVDLPRPRSSGAAILCRGHLDGHLVPHLDW